MSITKRIACHKKRRKPVGVTPGSENTVWFLPRLPALASKRRWPTLVAGLSAVAVLLTACASFEPRPLAPGEAAAAFEARRLADPGLKQFLEQNLQHEIAPWPPAAWDFPLLALAALYYNPELRVARTQWQAARAAIVTAGARPNPSLNTSAQYNATTVGISPWTWGLGLEFPIETAGKRGARLTRAQHLSDVARQRLASAAWATRSRLRASLIDWHGAEQRTAALTRQVRLQADYVAWLDRRQAGGTVPAFEVMQVRLALDRNRLALEQARRAAAQARAAIAQTIGVPLTALDTINIALDGFDRLSFSASLVPPELRRQALQGRADILGALASYAAAESALQLEIAKQYPDLRLGPGFTWDQGDNKWSLGLSLVLPAFQRNQGPIAEAEARRAEAEARFDALQSGVINEIERTIEGYRLALKELATAEALRAAAQERLRLLRARLRTGEARQVYLLPAQLELESAELARTEAQLRAQQALGALEDALQRPLDPRELAPAAPVTGAREPREGKP